MNNNFAVVGGYTLRILVRGMQLSSLCFVFVYDWSAATVVEDIPLDNVHRLFTKTAFHPGALKGGPSCREGQVRDQRRCCWLEKEGQKSVSKSVGSGEFKACPLCVNITWQVRFRLYVVVSLLSYSSCFYQCFEHYLNLWRCKSCKPAISTEWCFSVFKLLGFPAVT